MTAPPTLAQIKSRSEAIRRGWCDHCGILIPRDDRKLPVMMCVCDKCGEDLPNGVAASRCKSCTKRLNSGRLNEDMVHAYLVIYGPSTTPRIADGVKLDRGNMGKILRRQEGKRFRLVATKPKHLWEAIT